MDTEQKSRRDEINFLSAELVLLAKLYKKTERLVNVLSDMEKMQLVSEAQEEQIIKLERANESLIQKYHQLQVEVKYIQSNNSAKKSKDGESESNKKGEK